MESNILFHVSLSTLLTSCLHQPSLKMEANHKIPKERFAYTMQIPDDSEGIRNSFLACFEKLCPKTGRYEFSGQRAQWGSFPHFGKSDLIFSEFGNLDSLILDYLKQTKAKGETELSFVIDSEGKLPEDVLSDPKAALILGFGLAFSTVKDVDFASSATVSASEDGRGYEIKLDENAFEKVAEGPYKNLIPLTRRMIQSRETGQSIKIHAYKDNIELYYSILPGNIQDHIEDDRNRLKESIQRIEAAYPPAEVFIKTEMKSSIERVLNDNGYDKGDLLDFASLVPILTLFANFLEEDSQLIDFDLGETFELIYRDREVAEKAKTMKENLGKGEIERLRSNIVRIISEVYHGSPKSHEIGEFQKILENAVQDIENHVLTRFSPPVRTGLSNELKSIKWIFPEDRKVFLRKTVETLEEEIAEMKTNARQFENTPMMRALALVSFDPEKTLRESVFSNLYDLLEQLNRLLYPIDKSYSFDFPPNVLVSLTTMKSKVGIDIVKHELGHVINRYLDKVPMSDNDELQYRSIHECLNSMHIERPETVDIDLASGKKIQRGFYFSEDFADLVSATAKLQQETSYLCLVEPDADFRSIINDDNGDGHSGAFFRILHTRIVDKQKMPDECRDFLDNHYPQFIFRNCFE